jgi:hypothetical protein
MHEIMIVAIIIHKNMKRKMLSSKKLIDPTEEIKLK